MQTLSQTFGWKCINVYIITYILLLVCQWLEWKWKNISKFINALVIKIIFFSTLSSHCKFHTSNFITVSHKLTTIHREVHAREQEAEDESREYQGGELSTPAIPWSTRWRSIVRTHLIDYTTERNELESDSSSTTAMAVRQTQNGGVAVLRQIQHGIG